MCKVVGQGREGNNRDERKRDEEREQEDIYLCGTHRHRYILVPRRFLGGKLKLFKFKYFN